MSVPGKGVVWGSIGSGPACAGPAAAISPAAAAAMTKDVRPIDGLRLFIGVTIVTEVDTAICDARSGPTCDGVATGVSRRPPPHGRLLARRDHPDAAATPTAQALALALKMCTTQLGEHERGSGLSTSTLSGMRCRRRPDTPIPRRQGENLRA